jgi:hypothetical protein
MLLVALQVCQSLIGRFPDLEAELAEIQREINERLAQFS